MRPEVVRAIMWTLVAVAVAFYLAARLTVARNAGIEPGIGLRLDDAKAAAWKLVSERFRDQEPYNRGMRLVGTVARRPA